MARAKLDFLVRETEAEYREKAKTHLTSHALAEFRRCPLLYWYKVQGLIADEERPAYVLGRAAHVLILEGRECFDAEYVVGDGPVNARTGKPYGTSTQAYAEWASSQGKPVITTEQFALIVNLATGVRSHAIASALLSDGVPEGVIRTEYCGRPCQARLDFFNPERGIIDLKSADDIDWFEADARRYGYAYQLAFYRSLLAQVLGRKAPCFFVAVEKRPPFRAGVWRVTEAVLDQCQRENEAAIARLGECERKGAWPTLYEEGLIFDST